MFLCLALARYWAVKMPEKNPDLWAAFSAWLSVHQPQVYAGFMAAAVAMLRVVYGGGKRRQILLEGAICGLIGVALIPLLEWMAMPPNLATFGGCMVGFIGVEHLRDWAVRIGRRRVDE